MLILGFMLQVFEACMLSRFALKVPFFYQQPIKSLLIDVTHYFRLLNRLHK